MDKKTIATAAGEQAEPALMKEAFSNLLSVQKREAESGDPYMVGLYNGMSMMCANIDGDLSWTPMQATQAAPTAPEQVQALTDDQIDTVIIKSGMMDKAWPSQLAAPSAAAPAAPEQDEVRNQALRDAAEAADGAYLSSQCSIQRGEFNQPVRQTREAITSAILALMKTATNEGNAA